MAIVPTFEREDLPQPMQTGPQADILAAGIPGEALARLGSAGVSAMTDLLNQENFDYTQTNIAAAREKATNDYLKSADAAQQSGNYDGFTAGIRDRVAADIQQRIAGAPTPRAADALQKTFANLQDEFLTKAAVFEGAGHRTVAQGNIDRTISSGPSIVYRDPSQADEVYAQGKGVIYGGAAAGLNQGDLVKQDEKFKNDVYGAEVQAGIDNNPGAMLVTLKSGRFDQQLSEPQLEHFQEQAMERIRVQNAEARAKATEDAMMARGSVESAYQDNMASLKDTGRAAVPLSAAQIAAAYPHDPDRVAGMVASMQRQQQGYVVTKSIALSSPTDDKALMQSLTPQGPGYIDQAGTYNTARAAIVAKQAALSTDPAKYVQSNSPQVQQLFQAASNNPSLLPKAVAAQDALYDQLGVPPDQRTVLPQPRAAAIVGKLVGADPQNLNVGAALDQMQKAYTPALWPRVFADLVHNGLPQEYQTLANMDDPSQVSARQDYQRMLNIKAQKGGASALEDMAPKDASTAIKAGLPDALAEFQKTAVIPGASANVGVMSGMKQSVSDLAHLYAINGQDGATALENARNAVLGAFDMDGTIRVPKGLLPQAHAATDAISASLTPGDLAASLGVPSDIAAGRLADAKRSSSWFATPKGDGLMLMTQQKDGSWIRILRANGAPIQVSYDSLRSAPPPPLPWQSGTDHVEPGGP